MIKKSLMIIMGASLLTSSSFAAAIQDQSNHASFIPDSGFYLGLQLGYANLNYDKNWIMKESDGLLTSVGSVDNSGMAERVYLGYKFFKYMGIEVGAVNLSDVKFKNAVVVGGNSETTNYKFKQSIVDLFIKGMYPIQDKVILYGKVGYAEVRQYDANFPQDHLLPYNDYKDHLTSVPALGVGVSYNFTRGFFADIAYTRYFKKHYVEPIDLITAGIGYQFG